MTGPQLEAVSRLFGVLSEPSRLVLLHALRDGPLTVTDLVAASRMKQANVSKHLSVLHHHHLVRRERNGLTVLYEIADPTVFSLCDLVCGKVQSDARKAASLFTPDI